MQLSHTRRWLTVGELVVFALLSALLVCVQVVLAAVPNVELISLLVVLFALTFGLKSLYIVCTFVLLEGLLYGFGLWFINYLYIWPMLALSAWLLRRQEERWLWVALLTVFGFAFGLLCAIPYLFMGGVQMAFAYFVSGIPFDIIHGIANGVVALFLFQPFKSVLAHCAG